MITANYFSVKVNTMEYVRNETSPVSQTKRLHVTYLQHLTMNINVLAQANV